MELWEAFTAERRLKERKSQQKEIKKKKVVRKGHII